MLINIPIPCFSSRYLAKTYSHAFQFAKPDVVIFLGDLMDEGSTASSEEYKQYAKRLFNIFINKQTSTIRVFIVLVNKNM